MRILVRFQQNSTAPLQDTKKSVLIDSPLDRQNDRAFDSDDGAARVSAFSYVQVLKMDGHIDIGARHTCPRKIGRTLYLKSNF